MEIHGDPSTTGTESPDISSTGPEPAESDAEKRYENDIDDHYEPVMDGMGLKSDLTPLRGLNNPLEEVKWSYMSPPLEDERKIKPIHSLVFWSKGRPPKQRDLEKEKELAKLIIPRPGDKDYCILKYGDIPSPRPDYCSEHGWVSGPESVQPPQKPQLPDKILKRLDMVLIDKTDLAECPCHGSLKVNIFVEAEVVETINEWDVRRDVLTMACGYGHQPLRWLCQSACFRIAFLRNEPSSKYLPLDIKSPDGILLDPSLPIRDILCTGDKIIIDIASGPQTFREAWHGRPPPPAPESLIREYFDTLPKEHVVVDVPPPKDPPPKKKKKKQETIIAPPPPTQAADQENVDPNAPAPPPPIPLPVEPQFEDQAVQTPVDIVTFVDWAAYDIPRLLVKIMPDLDASGREAEFMVVKEILTAYSGTIQAIVMWFSGQGKELEDKDFGLLYLEQFLKIFKDMRSCPVPFSESLLKETFQKYVHVNNIPGSYQISCWGFVPILLHLTADMYRDDQPNAKHHEKIYHIIVEDFLPRFKNVLKDVLEDFHSAETTETLEALKERTETAKAAVKVIIPEYSEMIPAPMNMDPAVPSPGVPDLSTAELKTASVEAELKKMEDEEERLKELKNKAKDKKREIRDPIIFANAWAQVDLEVDAKTCMPYLKKWLALGERWDDHAAGGVIIYALQAALDPMEFQVRTATLRFGAQEILRFLLAASHCVYRRTSLVRMSEHSFLRSFMQEVFIRAKVEQRLYETYDQKLEYLRKQCFRQPQPLPALPEKKK